MHDNRQGNQAAPGNMALSFDLNQEGEFNIFGMKYKEILKQARHSVKDYTPLPTDQRMDSLLMSLRC